MKKRILFLALILSSFFIKGQEKLLLPAITRGAFNNYIIKGTGDGGTLTNYNTFFRFHYGFAIGSPFTNKIGGGYEEKSTIAFNARNGDISTLGTLYQNTYTGIRISNLNNKLVFRSTENSTELHSAGSTGIVFKNNGNSELMRLDNYGNIGIGTTTPSAKLDVNGNINVTSPGNIWLSGKTGTGGITSSTQLTSGAYHPLIRQKTSSGHFINLGGLGDYFGFFGYDKDRTINGFDHSMVMNLNTGNVGIGTISTGNHKLAVEGSIGAREIKVEASGWSDFVFYDHYKLPTLTEVENHIKEKGHLKDIPSAKEVEKNGFFLGEMDAKLLQKIEELTLYTIKHEKKIKALEKQNAKIEDQQKEIKELKSLVQKLLKDKN